LQADKNNGKKPKQVVHSSYIAVMIPWDMLAKTTEKKKSLEQEFQ